MRDHPHADRGPLSSPFCVLCCLLWTARATIFQKVPQSCIDGKQLPGCSKEKLRGGTSDINLQPVHMRNLYKLVQHTS
jgi:hypothetical protein